MNNRLRLAVLSSIGLAASTCLHAQLNDVVEFTDIGPSSYVVPADAGRLLIEVSGGSGGAGGWDDAPGGSGAGGSIVQAIIKVQGNESVSIHVGEGGKTAYKKGQTTFGQGAPVVADSQDFSGSGGRGGNQGSVGISSGGAGGGGASAVFIEGAAIIAGGGGGGGGNSRINVNGQWGIRGDDAINELVINLNDIACTELADGLPGQSANESANGPVDGAGGSGGGGGYPGNVGEGGHGGVDGSGVSSRNAGAGGSGASCTLSAGGYVISNVQTSLGEATTLPTEWPAAPAFEDGLGGFVRITPLAAEAIVQTTPVPTIGFFGLMGLAGAIGAAGVAMNRRRKQ